MYKLMIRFVMMIGIMVAVLMTVQGTAEEVTGMIPGKTESDNPQILASDPSVRFSILPYPFYSNLFQFGIGGFCSVSGLVSENSLMKAGGFISTNSSILGYLQYEEFQIPKMERFFVRPDLLFGKLGAVKNYMDLPLPREESFDTKPGVNESDRDNYFEVEGDYQWYECTFSYLVPIGYGRKHKVAHPVLRNGLLVGGETGGYHPSPWVCGRTFLQSRLSYRSLAMSLAGSKTKQIASGVEFILNVENVDYLWNPTRGYMAKLSWFTDWKDLGGDSEFDVLKADISWYFPLSEKNSSSPAILAMDIKTAHTPSWNDYHMIDFRGVSIPSYHRPPNFIGAFLGGPKTMRGYVEYRFYDCSSIYYCTEYRKILAWNPFDQWKLTRKIGVDWVQVAFFGELGRVAPDWNLKTLHRDMKWDFGSGLRFFLDGFLIRTDLAYGKEGTLFQMYYDYSF